MAISPDDSVAVVCNRDVGTITIKTGNSIKANDVPLVTINQVTPIYVGFTLAQTELVTPNDEGLPPVANLLAVTPVEAGKPLLYYLGAGWSKSGDFAAETDWENYVRQFVVRVRAPLQLKLKNK